MYTLLPLLHEWRQMIGTVLLCACHSGLTYDLKIAFPLIIIIFDTVFFIFPYSKFGNLKESNRKQCNHTTKILPLLDSDIENIENNLVVARGEGEWGGMGVWD